MQSFNNINEKNQLSFLTETQQGFTLLEILLVIVIMATITVFSIGIFQQQAVNAQISKTALQMQQWLEAAKAYYVDNNQWPDGNNFTGKDGKGVACVNDKDIDPTVLLLEGQCGPLKENNKIYIQSGPGIENNSWGQAFKLLPPSQQKNQNSNVFQVVSIVPGNVNNAFIIPQRLASLLPNATVDTFKNSVIAGVTIPGSASNSPSGVIVKSISDITCSDSSGQCTVPPKPTDCPPNMKPILHVAVKSFYSTGGINNPRAIGFLESLPNQNQGNDSWGADLQVHGPNNQLTHQGALLAIVTCEKTSSAEEKKNKINFFY